MQFGMYRGMTFQWLLENAPGYAGFIVTATEKEQPSNNHTWLNKMALKKYMEYFEEGKDILIKKRHSHSQGKAISSPASYTEMTDDELLVLTEAMEKETTDQKVSSASNLTKSGRVRASRVAPSASIRNIIQRIPVSTPRPGTATTATSSTQSSFTGLNITAVTPVSTARPVPATTATSSTQASFTGLNITAVTPVSTARPVPATTATSSTQGLQTKLCLPAGWKKTLPKHDHQWVAKALFAWTKKGGVEFNAQVIDRMWWYPLQPALGVNIVPGVDRYFARPLFLWMPRKLWKIRLVCPHSDCKKRELTSAGMHQKVRQVVDITGFYNMASEYLECQECHREVISWSHNILSQLDIGHRVQFPCILTMKLACDYKVIRLLRNRGLGNSTSQIQRKLEEQHGESYLQRIIHYLTDCSGFTMAVQSGLIAATIFPDPPTMEPVPKHRWLMQVYSQDVLLRLDEMKASITSIFGRILKMDSTKKVVKKLAGQAARTAVWCTNVGNEHGQVLTSVMTTGEGHGITPMLVGLVNRYTNAVMPPAEILYVDRDCCGATPLRQVLTTAGWETQIRLDVWHFMRRISTGCATDSHQLYASFMGHLSNVVFQWDDDDVTLLKEAKAAELELQHIQCRSDEELMRHINRYELSLHCRRRTRGVEATTTLLSNLIKAFTGDRGRDTLGVPLINDRRMGEIWDGQKKHVACLQDPAGVSLYTRTGTMKKGGVDLPTYRCARGSTSLESFHLHLNRFIPGTLANDVMFQAYLLDGLSRWNEDRAEAATTGSSDLHSYSGLMRHTANLLGEQVLGRKICPDYHEPRKYTGELLGMEYLYSQTGKVMEDYIKAIEDIETRLEPETVEDHDVLLGSTDDFEDLTISTIGMKEHTDFTGPDRSPVQPVHTEQPTKPVKDGSSKARRKPTVPTRLHLPTDDEYREMLVVNAPSPDHSAEFEHASQPVQPIQPPKPATIDAAVDSESVGPDDIPGFDKVQALAEFFVSIHNSSFLTSIQVDNVVQLWEALSDYDKQPTVFPDRYKSNPKGRFRATKKNVAPGVETTQRCLLGPNTGPASWPNCNRYTEATFIRLLDSFPNDKNKYSNINKAYNRIRDLILQNARVMRETKLQLPLISRGTLTQWHSKRGKLLDKLVLEQGVRFEQPSQTTYESLPMPLERPRQLPTGQTDPYTFIIPANTAGTAKIVQRRHLDKPVPVVRSIHPVVSTQVETPSTTRSAMDNLPQHRTYPICVSTAAVSAVPTVPYTIDAISATPNVPFTTDAITVSRDVPYTTQQYRKRKMSLEKEGVYKRKYDKKSAKIYTCKQCGQERKVTTHKQYFGNWFCSLTATISFEDWKATVMARGYGRKKATNTENT